MFKEKMFKESLKWDPGWIRETALRLEPREIENSQSSVKSKFQSPKSKIVHTYWAEIFTFAPLFEENQ